MATGTSLDTVFHLTHALKRRMHSHIESLGMDIAPMHIRVIKIIDKKSPCTAVDIVHFLHRDKAQVTRLIKTLIEQELVEKAPNPEDKRSQLLIVTAKGKERLEILNRAEAKVIESMTQNISHDDLLQFDAVAKKIAKNLSE
jgi:DNA-binding MarR family transcriptional regulator